MDLLLIHVDFADIWEELRGRVLVECCSTFYHLKLILDFAELVKFIQLCRGSLGTKMSDQGGKLIIHGYARPLNAMTGFC